MSRSVVEGEDEVLRFKRVVVTAGDGDGDGHERRTYMIRLRMFLRHGRVLFSLRLHHLNQKQAMTTMVTKYLP